MGGIAGWVCGRVSYHASPDMLGGYAAALRYQLLVLYMSFSANMPLSRSALVLLSVESCEITQLSLSALIARGSDVGFLLGVG